MATKDPLIGRLVRVNSDATTLKGRPHPNAGEEGTVQDKTPGGRQYQVLIGDTLANLPMSDFTVIDAPAATPGESDAPIHELAPSRTNRMVREDENLLAMAATMKVVGLLQPILVRRLPPARLHDTFENADTRRAAYEIIAGERRWVAAKIAGLKRVPILLKEADDSSALVMQLIENLHRQDLNPLEEARGVQRLLADHGYTRDDAAEALHKSRSHVFESLRLLNLCPEAQAAIEAGMLKRSVALLVAQRPTMAMQAEYTKRVLTEGPGNTPLSYRSALDLARRNYMTDLAQAPFALADAQLCPAAGACTTCPKRTGANPELWDKSGADVCTDTACFAGKKDAHFERMRRKAAERGQTVITGREAREIMPTEGGSPAGYLLLDKPSQGSDAPLRQVLGQDIPTGKVVLIETPSGAMVEAVPTRAAGAALEARSKAKAEKDKEDARDAPEPTREELQAEYQRRWRGAAIRAVIEGLRTKAAPEALDIPPAAVAYRVLITMAREASDDTVRAVFTDLPNGFDDADLVMAVRRVADTSPRLCSMVLMMLATDIDAEPLFERPADEAEQLNALAPIAQVDLASIRQQVQDEMKAEAAARAEARKPQPTQQPDRASPKLKGKATTQAATPKTTAAQAQAAIAQAMGAQGNKKAINAFEAGQHVRVRIDLKNAKGHLLLTKGAAGVITTKAGDRAWMLDVPDLPGGKGLIADYTELEAINE
jgi:ParB/RepB/Spo0J family partition protein